MSRVYLICGKICSGKTFLARKMEQKLNAVRLSVDDRMLAMNPTGLFGDKHDEIAAQVRNELLEESLQLIEKGIPVILDWGFWTREDRCSITRFYQACGVSCEWHYADVSDQRWEQNILCRNASVRNGTETGFVVDDGLRQKLLSHFEPPARDEMDVWHSLNDR